MQTSLQEINPFTVELKYSSSAKDGCFCKVGKKNEKFKIFHSSMNRDCKLTMFLNAKPTLI